MDHAASATESPFVNRERELRVLDGALREAQAGRARLVVVAGDPGVGKSRLVEEFVRRADLPAERVLWGRSRESAGAPSYWPWMRALRGWAERADLDAVRRALGDEAPTLAPIVPALGTGIAVDATADARARFRLFDATARLLEHVAADGPLVVVLEDLQWADDASLYLLEFVAGEIRRSTILLVATYRDRAPRPPRGLAGAVRAGQRIVLGGLDRDAIATFVSHATGGVETPGFVTRLHELTGGTPFFVDEVLRLLARDGRLDAAGLDGDIPLPDSVRDAVLARLEPLPDDDRELLAVAAVIGRDFDIALLQGVTGLSPAIVLDRLAGAMASGLVIETAKMRAFRFAHGLVRDAVYGAILPAARMQLHERVGTALEQLVADDPDAALGVLATHFFHAAPLGAASKAVAYATRAAERAVALAAHSGAMEHFEQALTATTFDAPDPARRLALRLAGGEAALRAGYEPRARVLFEQAARDARTLDDAGASVRAAVGFARSSPPSGTLDADAIGILEDALGRIGEEHVGLHALLQALLSQALYFAPERERAATLSAAALDAARRSGDTWALAAALVCRQLALLGVGELDERLALADESLALAERTGNDRAAHHSRLTRTYCLLERGAIARAFDEIEAAAREAAIQRHADQLWHVAVYRGCLALLAGRFGTAARLAAEALGARRSASDPATLQVYTLQTFLCRDEATEHAELEAAIRRHAAQLPGSAVWRCVLAVYLVELGRADEARQVYDGLAASDFATLPRDAFQQASLAWLARLVHTFADARRAARLYALLLPYADRNVVIGTYGLGCLGSAQRYLGLLAATAGMPDEADAHFRAAIAMNTAMGARPALAATEREYARFREDRAPSGEPTEPTTADDPRDGDAGVVAASLRREGEHWMVATGGAGAALKDTKGLRFLTVLLAQPGREVHVLDLDAATPGRARGPKRRETGTPLLDPEARAAYGARLDDLRDELHEARRMNDPGRASRARDEIEFLTAEVTRAVGLDGQEPAATAAAERARVNVSRTLVAAIQRIADCLPELGEHLRATVRTGYFCSYNPDPRRPIRWEL